MEECVLAMKAATDALVHSTTLEPTVKVENISLTMYKFLCRIIIIDTRLLNVSSCSGPGSTVCKGRRLSVICKSRETSGQDLPEICDQLNYII